MYQPNQNRSYFPGNHEQRNPFSQAQRPQTPLASTLNNMPNYNPNRSYGKLPQGQNYAQQQIRGNISKSRVSMASSHVSQLGNLMAEHMDIFP